MSSADEVWMGKALELAEQGRGSVEPNPLVGAVVVKEGQILGTGWHQKYGGPHAEVFALQEAGGAAQGGTLYVTLEPCCHFGKTPPCTEAILQAGVRRVVAAMSDPFPQVDGRGSAILRTAGVEVQLGVLEGAARRLNAPYLKLLTRARPYVHGKWAMSLDGKIATRTGESRWISNGASRRQVHELRGRMDAILIGIGTALADDPALTARPPGPRIPLRIILDSQARLPLSGQLVQTAKEVPVLVLTGDQALPQSEEALRLQGCEVIRLPSCQGKPSVPAVLDLLGRRRLTNLLVEGGSQILGSFLDAHEIDEVHVYLTSRLIGGHDAPSPVAGLGNARLAEALSLRFLKTECLDGDVVIHGWREDPSGESNGQAT